MEAPLVGAMQSNVGQASRLPRSEIRPSTGVWTFFLVSMAG